MNADYLLYLRPRRFSASHFLTTEKHCIDFPRMGKKIRRIFRKTIPVKINLKNPSGLAVSFVTFITRKPEEPQSEKESIPSTMYPEAVKE